MNLLSPKHQIFRSSWTPWEIIQKLGQKSMDIIDFGWERWQHVATLRLFSGFSSAARPCRSSVTYRVHREGGKERERETRQDETKQDQTRPDRVCAMADILQTIVFIYICVCAINCVYIYTNKCIALSLYLCMWLINRGDTAMGKIKLYKSTRRAFALSLATASSAPFNKAAA